MTWSEMDEVKMVEDDRTKALRAAVRRALDEEPLLEEFLRNNVQAASYSSGREFPQVAFAEGQRALARVMLQLGEKYG